MVDVDPGARDQHRLSRFYEALRDKRFTIVVVLENGSGIRMRERRAKNASDQGAPQSSLGALGQEEVSEPRDSEDGAWNAGGSGRNPPIEHGLHGRVAHDIGADARVEGANGERRPSLEDGAPPASRKGEGMHQEPQIADSRQRVSPLPNDVVENVGSLGQGGVHVVAGVAQRAHDGEPVRQEIGSAVPCVEKKRTCRHAQSLLQVSEADPMDRHTFIGPPRRQGRSIGRSWSPMGSAPALEVMVSQREEACCPGAGGLRARMNKFPLPLKRCRELSTLRPTSLRSVVNGSALRIEPIVMTSTSEKPA